MRQSKAVPHEEEPVRGELMTPDEVAEKLRVSPKTVYAMAANNEIAPHHIRSCVRLDSADVDDYIFFSKFMRASIKPTPSEIESVVGRLEDQIDHAKRYIDQFIAQFAPKRRLKEAGMKQ
jgi:excisionase family DNA binding protein